ncbi:MAG: FMN-binding protein [Treponema sp.]|jgi:electron transport complex protein RnfG|nr:FMN-binding protein [Treponema sp.]
MNFFNMIKLGIALALFATAACVGLAFVYTGTSATIEERQQASLEAALKELFPNADGFDNISGKIQSGNAAVAFDQQYSVQQGGKIVGAAVQASSPSYGGPIKALVGINSNGTISRVKILEHADTPGLGANAASPRYYVDKPNKITFTGQFEGKKTSDPLIVKEDVQAITASTITSRAVSLLVKASGDAASVWLTQNGGGK